MAVLETVRKAIADGDVDFLRAGVRVLAQAVRLRLSMSTPAQREWTVSIAPRGLQPTPRPGRRPPLRRLPRVLSRGRQQTAIPRDASGPSAEPGSQHQGPATS